MPGPRLVVLPRVERGWVFELDLDRWREQPIAALLLTTPTTDSALCADFDVLAPSDACLASCRDLFVPRLLPGDPPLGAPGCEGLSFFGCYAALDWDLGANSPIRVALAGGPDVLVLPAKDGAVYLVDAEHLGTLHDRHEVNVPCGTGGVRCDADWAGSMVTRPVLTTDADGAPLVLVATFLPDERVRLEVVHALEVRALGQHGRARVGLVEEAPVGDAQGLGTATELQTEHGFARRQRVVPERDETRHRPRRATSTSVRDRRRGTRSACHGTPAP